MSYGLNRAGANEVVKSYSDADRIMSAGFNWIPPSALADLIGYREAAGLLNRYNLPASPIIEAAAKGELPTPLFNLPFVTDRRAHV